jgi:hypothetical protein
MWATITFDVGRDYAMWATITVKQKMRPTSQPNRGPHHTVICGPHPMESPAHLDRNTHLFKLYVRYISDFGLLYGSLGTLIILMFWFYLSGVVILAGGAINAILEDAAAKHKIPGAKRRGQRSLKKTLDSNAPRLEPFGSVRGFVPLVRRRSHGASGRFSALLLLFS